MNYEEWVKSVPDEIKSDSLWKIEAYRLALFAADLGWYDVTALMRDKRTLGLSDQLYRALGAISGDIAEGFSRKSGKDKARFYEYGLGSTRESRDWYYKGRHVLGEKITNHRMSLLTQVIRLLITMIPQQRDNILREEGITYQTGHYNAKLETTVDREELDNLLQNVPLP
jgi:four helix bundle protein